MFTGRGHTVVLAVAPRRRPARFSLQLPWIGSATAAVSQTSTDRNDAQLRSVDVHAGVLGAVLPKGSVTTYVLPGAERGRRLRSSSPMIRRWPAETQPVAVGSFA